MGQAVLGFLGVILGAAIAGGVSLWQVQVVTKRERETRDELWERERSDRHEGFERETLLALQEAISDMRQAVFRDHELKMGVLAKEGRWATRPAGELAPEDWSQADERLSRLHARLFDDELQELVEYFREASGGAMHVFDPKAADRLTLQMAAKLDEINARIGVLLRRLF